MKQDVIEDPDSTRTGGNDLPVRCVSRTPAIISGDRVLLDGSEGEGGGQVIRTALALSIVTGRPFRITGIRARRPKPGLMRQHLACVYAAARISSADVAGVALGATEITFTPGQVVPGRHEFRIASAGSAMLLMQTVLLPLLLADQPSELVLEGGTHNPFAPPFPFIERAYLPLLRRIGFDVEAVLDRPGFYPNGGGRCRVVIRPATGLSPLQWEAVPAPGLSATVCLAGLSRSVAERELAIIRARLAIPQERCSIEDAGRSAGPGNTLHVIAEAGGFANVFTGFGAPKVRTEQVAEEAARAAGLFLASGATVDDRLADQLLLPLALARGGTFTTTEPTGHTRTNADVIRSFLSPAIDLEPAGPGRWRITVRCS